MIEKMKKISFFLFYKEKKKMLYLLQKQGVFHMELSDEIDIPRYRKTMMLQKRYENMISILSHINEKNKPLKNKKTETHLRGPKEMIQFLEDSISLKNNFKNAIQELEKQKKDLHVWGEFSWDRVLKLSSRGIYIRFFLGSDVVYDAYDFNGIAREEISRTGGRVYFITIEYGEKNISLPFEEITLPARSLSEIEMELSFLKENHRTDEEFLSSHENIEILIKEMKSLSSQMLFEQAKGSMTSDDSGKLFFIDGWYPVRREKEIFEFLANNGISYASEEPAESDDVPVLLHNGIFSKIFEPITKIFSLPDYFELDPTPFFAPFFTLFFGLCLGDAGYGAILFTASLLLSFKLKPDMKLFAWLGMILGLSAFVSGILTNSVFGEAIFIVDDGGPGFTEKGAELAYFSSRTIDGKSVFPAMHLSLLLGYIQIIIGQFIQIAGRVRNKEFIYAGVPLGSILIILGLPVLAAHQDFLGLGFNSDYRLGNFPLGQHLTGLPVLSGQISIVLGIFFIFIFNNPGKSFLMKPLLGLWEFYGFVTGLLGDFLSYIRLFALGLASGLLGSAFNQIAFMVLPDGENGKNLFSPWIVVAVFLLVAGHTLNLFLSLLGSFVHPLRLTFVEFYKNIKFKGGGKFYRPFAIIK